MRETLILDMTDIAGLLSARGGVWPRKGPLSDAMIRDGVSAISRLRDEVHGRNVAAGWWTDLHTGHRKHRNVGELLMLSVSELAEGCEGAIDGLPDDKLPQYSMLTVELADCAIRIFDLAAGNDVDLAEAAHAVIRDPYIVKPLPKPGDSRTIHERLMFVVCYLARAMEGHRKSKQHAGYPGFSVFAIELAHALLAVVEIARDFGLPLSEAFADKLLFNAVRPDHKPEARRAAGGKAY